MDTESQFKKWALSFAGCDGGDVGSRDDPSIWVCGIEWGGGHTPDSLCKHMTEIEIEPPAGYVDWSENLSYIFNWQIVKLLHTMSGGKVGDYKKYAESVQPFTQGASGFFKMNLFPIAFKNTNEEQWRGFSKITGFETKSDYLSWCRGNRIPMIRRWSEIYSPKAIVCLGKTYLRDFSDAFGCNPEQFIREVIDERDLFWQVNKYGTLVVVLPFMVNRNGLVKNVSIQKVGEYIGELLTSASSGRCAINP